jgi:ADP-ribose pyrophosphatase YjhB (NUDIX family)
MPNIRIRVAGVLIKDNQILLVRHEKNAKSYWLLPGGGVDFGETAEEALIREFKEEVGLTIEVGKLVFVHDSIPPDRHRQTLNLYFLATTKDQSLKVTPDSVLRDAAYYSLTEFSKMQVNPDIKTEILEGLDKQWFGESQYLGNRWKD